jgi:ribosomal protein S18 acetylase RimI-like enzyme
VHPRYRGRPPELALLKISEKVSQRKGLTKALMYSGMQRMKGAGMETALVLYHADNEAARALYTSAGLRPVHGIYEYHFTK